MELRRQPVVPLRLTLVRSKPPAKNPHDIFDSVNISPIFRPVICTNASEVDEQTSPEGCGSPIRVNPPLPPATILPSAFWSFTTPLVWPETRSIAPSVDGPN